MITFRQITGGAILVAGLYTIFIITFEICQSFPFLKFFLICIMGCAFLIIWYIMKK